MLITRAWIDVTVGEDLALSVDAAAGTAQGHSVMIHVGPLVPSSLARSDSSGTSYSVDRSTPVSSSVSALHAIQTRLANRRSTPFCLNEGFLDCAFHDSLARHNYPMQRIAPVSNDSLQRCLELGWVTDIFIHICVPEEHAGRIAVVPAAGPLTIAGSTVGAPERPRVFASAGQPNRRSSTQIEKLALTHLGHWNRKGAIFEPPTLD